MPLSVCLSLSHIVCVSYYSKWLSWDELNILLLDTFNWMTICSGCRVSISISLIHILIDISSLLCIIAVVTHKTIL